MSDLKLTYEQKNAFSEIKPEERDSFNAVCKEYIGFLNACKTERECVDTAIELAKENGFVSLDEKQTLKPGDKVYDVNRGKGLILAIVGSEDIENGINIVGSHVDSPRLDLKQNPLYESCGMSLLKTHYYGGIKKYQWTAMPLSIHGVIFTKDGEKINIVIGESDEDPVFCITDLLPHLGKDQMNKKMSEGIEGEALNILVGGIKLEGDEKEAVKYNTLKIVNEKYGITERDFISAEIEVVPAYKAREVGFDRAFIGSYGQDDRVCAFTAMKAIFDINAPAKTAICLFVDKEEIGSAGNTGMLSAYFEMMVAEIIGKVKGSCDLLTYNRVIRNSACLSSDVGAAVDPNYESVSEKRNSAFAGNGMVIMKYTGARGKSGSSDANSEFVYKICKMLDDDNVIWQTSELGKVDQGGGGTIAQYVANLNMDVIDCGVPVLSMHSPFEITAKSDVYMAYKSYKTFYNN